MESRLNKLRLEPEGMLTTTVIVLGLLAVPPTDAPKLVTGEVTPVVVLANCTPPVPTVVPCHMVIVAVPEIKLKNVFK